MILGEGIYNLVFDTCRTKGFKLSVAIRTAQMFQNSFIDYVLLNDITFTKLSQIYPYATNTQILQQYIL